MESFAGALNAGFIALGFTAARVEELAAIWSGLRTSASIPGVFAPVTTDGRTFVDGGGHPVDAAAAAPGSW